MKPNLTSKPGSVLTVLFAFSFPTTILAVPVYTAPIQVSQPNSELPGGHRFVVHPRGDEWGNWYETDDGYSVIRDRSTGVWHYAQTSIQGKLEAIGAVVGRDQPAAWGIKKYLRPKPTPKLSSEMAAGAGQAPSVMAQAAVTPITGDVPTLFILVKFLNRDNTYTAADFAAFQADQLRAYFNEVSYGQMQTTPAAENHGSPGDGVIGWLALTQNHPDFRGGFNDDTRRLAANAIIAADPYINFADYDRNTDGYVDSNELAVVIIPAGYETSYGGPAYAGTPSVWGHVWSLGWGAVAAPGVDGVYVGDLRNGNGGYTMFGEIQGYGDASSDHQATLGVMAHELGHLIMKWPDLYDYDGSSAGLGSWSLMAAGPWAMKPGDQYPGQTPVHPDAWCKVFAGWVTPVLNTVGTFSLPAVGSALATSLNAVQIQTTSDPKQYFLFENRGQYGFDRGLSSIGSNIAGIAVYHIDEGAAGNSDDWHRLVDIEAADGVDFSTPTNLFYAGNQTTIDDSTTPGTGLYEGNATGIALNTVSTPMENMTANFGAAPAQDEDGDGIANLADNCLTAVNPDQLDTNGDGFGNRCDGDFDGNGFVNFKDLSFFQNSFGSNYPHTDLDGNGMVNFADLALFRNLFGKAPGPTGVPP